MVLVGRFFLIRSERVKCCVVKSGALATTVSGDVVTTNGNYNSGYDDDDVNVSLERGTV